MPLSRLAHPAPKPSVTSALAFLVALVAFTACGKKEEAKAPPVPEVTVAEVIQRDVPIGGELTGTVHGFEDIEIRARVEGYLKTMDYREGAEVKKGQLLFTIDDQPYRARLAEAKGKLARTQAAYTKANNDVKRFTPLVAERAISQAELDNAISARDAARAEMESSKADVEKATLDLGYCRLTSPLDGLTGAAKRKVGDLVGKGEPTLLTTVSSVDRIRVSVNLPEALYLRYADRLPSPGTEPAAPTPERPGAELVLGDGKVYPHRGQLILVDRSVDSQTGTLRADLSFPNPDRILRPGLYAKIRYREEERKGALLVPQRAVLEMQGQFSVVVVNPEGKAETRKAKMGPRTGSLWIVEEGVKPGERVIVEGALKARDGMPVKATVAPPEPAPAPAPASGEAPAPAPTPAGTPAK